MTTTGLESSLVYDIPNFATDSEEFVHGTIFEVTCGAIPGATQSGAFNLLNGTFPIHIDDKLQDIYITPSLSYFCYVLYVCSSTTFIASRTLNIRPAIWRSVSFGLVTPPVILLASTFPVVADDTNTIESVVPINPAISSTNCVVSTDCGERTLILKSIFTKNNGCQVQYRLSKS